MTTYTVNREELTSDEQAQAFNKNSVVIADGREVFYNKYTQTFETFAKKEKAA